MLQPRDKGSATESTDGQSKSALNKKRSNQRFSGFQGKTDDIKDHVYDIGPQAKDLFLQTTREIGKYIACTYQGGGKFINAMNPDNLGFDAIEYPPDPDPSNVLDLEQWRLKIKHANEQVHLCWEVSKQAFAVVLGQ